MRLLPFLLAGIGLLAQAPTQPSPEHLAAMKKLSFLVGEWRGESWTQMGPQKRSSTGTEVVQSKLNGTILTVEGSFSQSAPWITLNETAWRRWRAPKRFTSMTALHSSGSASATGLQSPS